MGDDRVEVRVRAAERSLRAVFAKPAFRLLRDAAPLLDQLVDRLAPHGLGLSDVRVEAGDGSVAGAHLACDLRSLDMSLQVHVHELRLAHHLRSDSDQDEPFVQVLSDSLDALRADVPELDFKHCESADHLHGDLPGHSVVDFLSRFTANAPPIGPLEGSGVVLYFGANGTTLSSSVTLDRSLLTPSALFVGSRATWDVTMADPLAVARGLNSWCHGILDHLGLARTPGE